VHETYRRIGLVGVLEVWPGDGAQLVELGESRDPTNKPRYSADALTD
jgi:hypothetical protein